MSLELVPRELETRELATREFAAGLALTIGNAKLYRITGNHRSKGWHLLRAMSVAGFIGNINDVPSSSTEWLVFSVLYTISVDKTSEEQENN